MPALRCGTVAALLLAAGSAAGLELMVESGHARCLTEQLPLQGLALINWETDAGAKVGLKVLTPSGTVLHEVAPTVRDHVGFQAKEAGDYQACFEAAPPTDSVQPADKDKSAEKTEGDAAAGGESNATQGEGEHGAGPTRVRVDWLTGVGARDWDAVAKKTHVTEVTAALGELEAELNAVYTEMLAMRKREEAMRDTSERVNAKISWMSVLSLSVSCSLAAWQISSVKRYLSKKKII